jgi:tetratricopeptide (TPR) repeat protein
MYDQAAAEYQKAQKLTKNSDEKAASLYNLGNTYLQNNDAEKAVNSYKNALKYDPDNKAIMKNLQIAKKKKIKNKTSSNKIIKTNRTITTKITKTNKIRKAIKIKTKRITILKIKKTETKATKTKDKETKGNCLILMIKIINSKTRKVKFLKIYKN